MVVVVVVVWWIKIEQLISKRAAETKELKVMKGRVDELSKEQKGNCETIGQLSAQRDELQRVCDQHSDDLGALRTVSKWFKSLHSEIC